MWCSAPKALLSHTATQVPTETRAKSLQNLGSKLNVLCNLKHMGLTPTSRERRLIETICKHLLCNFAQHLLCNFAHLGKSMEPTKAPWAHPSPVGVSQALANQAPSNAQAPVTDRTSLAGVLTLSFHLDVSCSLRERTAHSDKATIKSECTFLQHPPAT